MPQKRSTQSAASFRAVRCPAAGRPQPLSPPQRQQAHASYLHAVQQLAAGVAHEFNNLLGGISGATERLHGMPGNDRDEAVKRIHALALKGGNISAELLAFSRRSHLQPVYTDIRDCVSHAVARVSERLGALHQLKTTLCRQPLPVYADAEKIEESLGKLLLQSRSSMPRGGRIDIRCSICSLNDSSGTMAGNGFVAHRGGYACVRVRDTRPCPPAKELRHLFEPYRGGPAAGLAMASVYGIIKQHNGYIVAQAPSSGGGLCIRLYLPLCAPEGAGASHRPLSGASPPSVLVAMHEACERKECIAALRAEGIAATAAAPKSDAAATLSRAVSAVLLDLQSVGAMRPGRLRRALGVRASTPLIVACRNPDLRTDWELRSWGAAAVIDRPPDTKQFLYILARIAGSRAAPSPPK